jgi:hypothetical protein
MNQVEGLNGHNPDPPRERRNGHYEWFIMTEPAT